MLLSVLTACVLAQDPPVEATSPVEAAEPAVVERRPVEVNGYLSSRTTYSRSRVSGLIATDDMPQVSELLELNAQLKIPYARGSFVYADASALLSVAGGYRGINNAGDEVVLPSKDVSQVRPAFVLSELYLLHEFAPQFNALVGKKRINWGPGFAFSPTDLLNIRDPTDPTAQRNGAWLVRAELPFEFFTLSAVFAPTVTKSVAGLPQAMLLYPEWDKKDSEAHYQLAARLYALLWDSDVNVMFFWGNKSVDAFATKPRVGVTFSRYFFSDYELHVDALFQSGSTRDYVNETCVKSTAAALDCALRETVPISKARLNDPAILPRVLVGSRYQFPDESLLSVEYLYQADGYSQAEFTALVQGLQLLKDAKALGIPANLLPAAPGAASQADGTPQRFNFDPARRHYLFISYQKTRIFDDFTAQLVTLVNLEDLSSLWTPSVSWSATEWLTLSAFGFIPVRGLDSLGVRVASASGAYVTEYSNIPFAARVMFEARVFY